MHQFPNIRLPFRTFFSFFQLNAENPHGWLSFVADVDPQAVKRKWRCYEMVKGKSSGWHTQKCQRCLQSASCVRMQRAVPELASPQPHVSMICYLTSKWLMGSGSSIDKRDPRVVQWFYFENWRKVVRKQTFRFIKCHFQISVIMHKSKNIWKGQEDTSWL